MNEDLIELTSDIVSAHVSYNNVAASDLPMLIASVHAALVKVSAPAVPASPAKLEGAVSARNSVASSGHILSMIDGKPYKTLKRHIGRHGYTPESYKEAFGLPKSYPMVAESYASARREIAKTIGLGRRKTLALVEDAEAKVGAIAGAIETPIRAIGKKLGIAAAKAAAAEHLRGGSETPQTKS
jgi:predicted transcriptional regulator